MTSVTAVVVTRNRPALLQRALAALRLQTRPIERVLVVDNASTEETARLLDGPFGMDWPALGWLRLPENLGGAGGFRIGMEQALAGETDWIWAMDDDSAPAPDALAALLASGPGADCLYACAAVVDQGDPAELVWPVVPQGGGSERSLLYVHDLPTAPLPVHNAPLIGLFCHRDLLLRIGLPDAAFFVSFEDAELCARAWRYADGVRLVGNALVRHPRIPRRCFRLLGRQLCVIEIAPWRRYYDTRNRLVLAKRHFGRRLWTEALPGTLLRWLVTLVVQPRRLAQSWAFARGIADGLTERLGMRWPPPG